MTTLLQLLERVSRDLHDPDNATFSTQQVGDLLDLAMAEVSRIVPLPCRETHPAIVNQLEYTTAITEPSRCELWEEGDLETAVTLATSSATDDTFDTATAHGYAAGDAVEFSGLTGGAGLTEDTAYYVLPGGLTETTFRVATSQGGSHVNFTTNITAGSVARVAGTPLSRLRPLSAEYVNDTEGGWEVWGGKLRIPHGLAEQLTTGSYLLRLWGYRPRARLTDLEDVAELDENTEAAVREYAVLQGYQRLVMSRALYTQWQQVPQNTDASFAGLLNAVGVMEQNWNRRRRQLVELRVTP